MHYLLANFIVCLLQKLTVIIVLLQLVLLVCNDNRDGNNTSYSN